MKNYVISRVLFGDKKFYSGHFLGEPKFQSERGNAAQYDNEEKAKKEAEEMNICDYLVEEV